MNAGYSFYYESGTIFCCSDRKIIKRKWPLSHTVCGLIDTAQRVERAWVADVRHALRCHSDEEVSIVADARIGVGMTGQLRLAPTLGGKEEVDCEGSGSFTPCARSTSFSATMNG